MARFTVILDACVLYPAPLRDFLMELATAGLYRARWTDRIHEEWIENLLQNRSDLTREKLHRTRDLMNKAVPDSLVSGYEYLIESLSLPDPDDRHVLAAAIAVHADAIVTFNLKDFPELELDRPHLEAIHPDDFIVNQIDLDLSSVLVSAQRCLKRLKTPPITVEQWFATLEGQSLPKTVAALKTYATVLRPG